MRGFFQGVPLLSYGKLVMVVEIRVIEVTAHEKVGTLEVVPDLLSINVKTLAPQGSY